MLDIVTKQNFACPQEIAWPCYGHSLEKARTWESWCELVTIIWVRYMVTCNRQAKDGYDKALSILSPMSFHLFVFNSSLLSRAEACCFNVLARRMLDIVTKQNFACPQEIAWPCYGHSLEKARTWESWCELVTIIWVRYMVTCNRQAKDGYDKALSILSPMSFHLFAFASRWGSLLQLFGSKNAWHCQQNFTCPQEIAWAVNFLFMSRILGSRILCLKCRGSLSKPAFISFNGFSFW